MGIAVADEQDIGGGVRRGGPDGGHEEQGGGEREQAMGRFLPVWCSSLWSVRAVIAAEYSRWRSDGQIYRDAISHTF
jgi:hypothetical protein